MDGIFGWLAAADDPLAVAQDMARAARLSAPALQLSDRAGVGAGSRFARAGLAEDGTQWAACMGRPRFHEPELARHAAVHGDAATVLVGWQQFGDALPEHLGGSFALAVFDSGRQRGLFALDRMGIERLCWAQRGAVLVFATSVQAVAAHPAVGRVIDPQSIYEYLYFHAVPAPRTVYRDVAKLMPGQRLRWDGRRAQLDYYWHADYSPQPTAFAARKEDFRSRLDAAVRALDTPQTAAFLSGGTDSSTVVGALTGVRGAPVDTYSIGFDATGYDEMAFARCAAERFGSRSHEYYVTPADIVTGIPLIATAYDEPFGNDSGVPTYFCARAAADAGFTRMFAGDGGDEIFGGNARYAKQKIFEHYARVPGWLRRGVIDPLAHLPGISKQFPFSKLRSYVEQANLGLPLRMESYNFLHRTPLAEIFEPGFLGDVTPSHADELLVEVYQRAASDHYLNRMMHLDLKFTLADNDLRKVGTMTELAGIEVAYPLLDDGIVEFAHALPVDDKVRGQRLRWFFKEALTDLLPDSIINKSKHGFGLPFGVWATQYAPLGELVGDSLSDFKRRGWIRPDYLDHMLAMQRTPHANYYGVMIWVAMMLERWLAEYEA